MDIENAKKASKMLEEIEELSKYKTYLNNKEHGKVSHFNFVQHYGNAANTVVFDPKYNQLFIPVVEQIIQKLVKELSEL